MSAPLERGREAYARKGWSEAFESLSAADAAAPLDADDLDLLATTTMKNGKIGLVIDCVSTEA